MELMERWGELRSIARLGQEPKPPKRNVAISKADALATLERHLDYAKARAAQ